MASSYSNIPNLLFMVRPLNFGFNEQTAESNAFQQNKIILNAAEKARVEFDAMVKRLVENNIELAVFDDMRNDLPDSVFCNNWITQIPNNQLTIFPMFNPSRRNEIRPDVIDNFQGKLGNIKVVDLTSFVHKNQFLESTGSIVFCHKNKVAFACISPRTDVVLFESYCAQIGYKAVSFIATDLSGNKLYHTNVLMSIGHEYVIICLDAIESAIERAMLKMEFEKCGLEIIEITHQQMNHFVGNCLQVMNKKNELFLLMSTTAFKHLKEEQKTQIQKFNQILHFDIPTIETLGGGSVRCMLTGFFI